jgi:gliding motility-associated-like protein
MVSDPDAVLTANQVYYITMQLPSGCVTTDTLSALIIAKDVVYIPSAFTPNGDGKNDLFVIAGINNYPGSSLAVYDRWGKRVYFSSSYNNDWDGGELSPGTYVYMLQVKMGEAYQFKKGFVEIIR